MRVRYGESKCKREGNEKSRIFIKTLLSVYSGRSSAERSLQEIRMAVQKVLTLLTHCLQFKTGHMTLSAILGLAIENEGFTAIDLTLG